LSNPSAIAQDQPDRRHAIRLFLGTGVMASLASFLYPILRYIIPPKTVEQTSDNVLAGRVGDLKPNTGKIFRFGSRPGLLTLTADGKYHAVSAVCTHLNCTVQYRSDLSQIWCACHNGHYDLNGKNVAGPPPRPLDTFVVNVRGTQIVVSKSA
jgi:Rieske Fe-S protein